MKQKINRKRELGKTEQKEIQTKSQRRPNHDISIMHLLIKYLLIF